MKSLIIGNGQIGSALHKIFSLAHESYIRDFEHLECRGVAILHVAYPYSESFVDQTLHYIDQYKPNVTVIHSSVPVGTTDKCGDHVVHSPERGRHPNLANEMLCFPKFIGGRNEDDLLIATAFFAKCSWPCIAMDNPCATELIKLLSNAHLGLEIAWRQEVDRMFSAYGVREKDIYDSWEDSYNVGHTVLGQQQLIRPRMRPDPIGGHCVKECVALLSDQIYSQAFEFIRRSNAKREEEQKRQLSSVGAAAKTATAG